MHSCFRLGCPETRSRPHPSRLQADGLGSRALGRAPSLSLPICTVKAPYGDARSPKIRDTAVHKVRVASGQYSVPMDPRSPASAAS